MLGLGEENTTSMISVCWTSCNYDAQAYVGNGHPHELPMLYFPLDMLNTPALLNGLRIPFDGWPQFGYPMHLHVQDTMQAMRFLGFASLTTNSTVLLSAFV